MVIVTPADVERMLGRDRGLARVSLSVRACVSRAAPDSVSRLRWRDVDLAEGTIRFREKGDKISVKPMPNELHAILHAAMESAEVGCGPDDYVIPNRRPASVRGVERSNKIIWETVPPRGCTCWRSRNRPFPPTSLRGCVSNKSPWRD